MRLSPSFLSLALVIFVSEVVARNVVARASNPASVTGTRKVSLLKNVAGLPAVPTAQQVAVSSLNTDDIQGDILVGMHKQQQRFYFFTINDAATFKTHLAADIAPVVASVTQLSSVSTQPLVALNIAFSQTGLNALGVTDNVGDALFTAGQASNTVGNLKETTDNWVTQFKTPGIHGVILLASDDKSLIDQQEASIQSTFGAAISKVYSLDGAIRPGAEAGHEMFGFLDGIAQPAISGLGTPLPGQLVVDEGVIIVGGTNDPIARPADGWMTGGSFLAFRQLEQLVPEFNKYLLDNAPAVDGKSLQDRADLLGARMVGRWKSGAPIDLTPLADDPALGADPQRNNNFDFTHANFSITTDQTHCPFSAHIRKTRPRADLVAPANSIIRSGIPYGSEVSAAEAAANATTNERGLAFVSYQSQLNKGFQFLQNTWANNPGFIFGKNVQPGQDPIIGQNSGAIRSVVGLDPANPTGALSMGQFVVSRGGEYFFSPPISALTGKLAA
ncbi:fungal peroxidase [Exidia glandulosa HHB12029]|uniref:Fungal peroxidase n=1 Tax=Exidia glandulosa HHB12029 TaxID=1314781 RepID=A0A166ARP7_EXIGL|nr:fungal peroxidase [Exidia glandulosa HHB12029]